MIARILRLLGRRNRRRPRTTPSLLGSYLIHFNSTKNNNTLIP